MLLVSFQTKHFLFWVGIFIIVFGTYFAYNRITADVFTSPNYSQLDISENAVVTLNGQDISSSLTPGFFGDMDTFFYQIYNAPGRYIGDVTLVVNLPDNLSADLVKIEPIITYTSIPKANVATQGNKIIILGYGLDSQALFSLKLLIPKGYLDFPLGRLAGGFLQSQAILFWIVISAFLPTMTFFVLFKKLREQAKIRRSTQVNYKLSELPGMANPAVVAVLYNGKITSRAISAFVLQMANKGLLEIVFKNDHFSFARFGQQTKEFKDANLEPAEKALISKIFKDTGFKSSDEDVQFRITHRLFSDKIATFYYLIYDEAFSLGYFNQTPHLTHKKWRNGGLAVFFSGILGATLALLFAPVNLFWLWLGLVVAGGIIIKNSSQINYLSPKGLETLRKWKALKNYLTNPIAFTNQNNTDKIFTRFLPFALAMGVEEEWVQRFREVSVDVPEWYVCLDQEVTIKNFSQNLLNLLNWLSSAFTFIKDPRVE